MKRALFALVLGMLALGSVSSEATAQDVRRYVRYEDGGTIWWGLLEGETIHQLSSAPYLGGARTGESVQRSAVDLKAPVDPKSSFMTAYNFRSHLTGPPAAYPGLFMVPVTSIAGPGDAMVHPVDTNDFHYEAEAVIVIGQRCDNVSVEDAPDCVFGLTAGNDGSARDWQANDIQWTRAKGTKTFNPVGPELVTGVDYTNVMIEGRLNGEVVQGENTSDMLFSFNEMVSYLSRYFTLEPGDIIWSGTMGTTQAMKPGDVFEVEIDHVGTLRNTVVMGE